MSITTFSNYQHWMTLNCFAWEFQPIQNSAVISTSIVHIAEEPPFMDSVLPLSEVALSCSLCHKKETLELAMCARV